MVPNPAKDTAYIETHKEQFCVGTCFVSTVSCIYALPRSPHLIFDSDGLS
jgi:hypothetical protein